MLNITSFFNRLFSLTKYYNEKNTKEVEEDNGPIKYSTSKAAKWKAEVTRTGQVREAPWFEPYIVIASLSVFMIYFFILREESDIDTEFDKTLYERVTGMEEKQIEIALKYNLEHGLPTKELKERLEELRREKR